MRDSPDNPLPALTSMMDILNAGACLIEQGGWIVHANPRLCAMIGRDLRSLIGQNARSLYGSADPASQAMREELWDAGDCEGELSLPQPDGSLMPIIVSGRHLPFQCDGHDYALVTIIDITHQKRAEQQAKTQEQQVAQLTDVLIEQALDLKHQSQKLAERVRERTADLHDANMEAITMLAVASEAKDTDTGTHILRIRQYTQALAREFGIPEDKAEHFGHSAILHDVGKIQVPDEILQKPAQLTDDERQIMQTHTTAGHRILSKKKFFRLARQVARSHHERWDGSGYPDGLSGDKIPLAARIVALADVYDALTSKRPYKPAWPPEKAAELIHTNTGRQFDPELVRLFDHLYESGTLAEIAKQHRSHA